MSEITGRGSSCPESLGLQVTDGAVTYLSEEGFDRVWIGSKWDLGQRGNDVKMYRKGNYFITVHDLSLACQIIADQEYLP